MGPGTSFQPVIAPETQPSEVRKVILLSGKIYYDLDREIKARGLTNQVALIRVEELCPFPFERLTAALAPYTAMEQIPDICWVQEEARNQGSWSHVALRIGEVFNALGKRVHLQYVGRKEAEVPAVGIAQLHQRHLRELFDQALA